MPRVLITGGAGFIASHLVDRLVIDNEVIVLDDLSSGTLENISYHMNNPEFTFLEGSITSEEDVSKALEDVTTVYHFAAQPDVRLGINKSMEDFRVNMIGGMTLLEAMRVRDIDRLVFASSGGTVYGDSNVLPTPEETAFSPISNYGAAKCAFEMYLSSYSELYGMSSVSLRLANIIGPRLTHGVIYDFYLKLKKDSTRLEVLGTGQQEKSYQYVTDTIEATILLEKKLGQGHLPVNVSSGERLTVAKIAELVCEGLGVPNARIEFTGSKRGWAGDVITTDLDISLLKSFGWESKVKIADGVRQYLEWIVESFGPIK
ncbi:MAG: NAD-dependent epimerase/dehydratase family protein [Candidatus Thorarchaeota archaeon]